MELKNVLAVIAGLFIVLVSMSLFSDKDLFTGNAAVDLEYQNGLLSYVPKGNHVNIKITSNANGVLKQGSVILSGASCSTAVAKSSFNFCTLNDPVKIGKTTYYRCKGSLNLNIATNNLNAGSSYKIRYKEFTSTSISSYRCSAKTFTIIAA